MKILITVVFSLFFILNAYADIIYIPADTATIQGGIDMANPGDTVLVADSTYFENINFKGKAITVASQFLMDRDTSHISATVIDGSQPSDPDSGSVVCFINSEDTTSILCGFTITGGTGTHNPYPNRIGGGIVCLNSGAKISHNIIQFNSVQFELGLVLGGGITAGPPGNTSWIVLEHNIIRRNTIFGTHGGGGGIALAANALIKNNTIEFNTAESTEGVIGGGGVYLNLGAPLPLTYERHVISNRIRFNKAISPNGAGGNGGGLAVKDNPMAIIKHNDISYNEVESNDSPGSNCWGGGVILQNQTEETIFAENWVTHNRAINNSICRGAGINIWNLDNAGSPNIIKNIIANNTYGTYGGGIFIGGHFNNSARLINNTICDNTAEEGGAIYIGWNGEHVSHPRVENSILWNNGSSVFVNSGDVQVSYCDVEGGWSGTGNIDVDPLFSDTLFHLGSGSPCIDSGNPSNFCNDSDGTRNDMGRYGGISDSLIYHITGLFKNENKFHLPQKIVLYQNYPNPFNPTTSIEFSIPKIEFVIIKIYNVLGQEVTTLVSEKLNPGSYKYTWDAFGFASGVYYYKLEADGGFMETKKLILLK